jgi:glutaredoxin
MKLKKRPGPNKKGCRAIDEWMNEFIDMSHSIELKQYLYSDNTLFLEFLNRRQSPDYYQIKFTMHSAKKEREAYRRNGTTIPVVLLFGTKFVVLQRIRAIQCFIWEHMQSTSRIKRNGCQYGLFTHHHNRQGVLFSWRKCISTFTGV